MPPYCVLIPGSLMLLPPRPWVLFSVHVLSSCAVCLLGYHSSQLSGIGRRSQAGFCFALLFCLCVLPADGPLSVRTAVKCQRKTTAVAVRRCVESYLSPADTVNILLWFFCGDLAERAFWQSKSSVLKSFTSSSACGVPTVFHQIHFSDFSSLLG